MIAVLDTYAINDDGTRDHMERITLKGPRVVKQAIKLVGLGSKHTRVHARGRAVGMRGSFALIHCDLGRDGHLMLMGGS